MLTMMLIDDEYLVKLGIRETINWKEYGIEIVIDASNGKEGLELAQKYNPDIILVDMRMPVMDGMEFMRQARENGLTSYFIVLSGHEEFNYVKVALQYGAEEYLLKPVENQELIDTVLKVARKIKEDRGIKQYYHKLQNELSSIKKQFLADLIYGNIKEKETILEKLAFLEIPVDLKDNFVLVIKLQHYQSLLQNLSSGALKELKAAVNDSISRFLLLHSSFIGVVNDNNLDEWVIILHTECKETIIELLKDRCVKLLNHVKESHGVSLSVGISRLCNDIANIHTAYSEACEALGFEQLSSVSKVIYYLDKDFSGYRKEIRETIGYIRRNYMKNINVEMAAKELYMSSSRLMHIFREDLGQTFNDCLTDYRIQVAKDLLRENKYRVYEICEKVGYSDVKYFSQVFKKVTGQSPREFINK
jgi:two-component system, response regulator YesN